MKENSVLNLSELENIHADIEAVFEITHSVKARIDGKEIEMKILRNSADHYFYDLSHIYQGADNVDPDVSAGENCFSTADEAIKGALRKATLFYRSMDEGGAWVKNEAFIQ
jgi:hypothetical protein